MSCFEWKIPWRIIAAGEYFRGACMPLRAAPLSSPVWMVKADALRTKGTAGRPVIIREHTSTHTQACRLKKVSVLSIVDPLPVGRVYLVLPTEGSAP